MLETPGGYVIFDDKTFSGRGEAAVRAKVTEFLPQFAAYAEALRRLDGKSVVGAWVHLPASGAMVEVSAFHGAPR